MAEITKREIGFYWVQVREDLSPRIAEYVGSDNWYLAWASKTYHSENFYKISPIKLEPNF